MDIIESIDKAIARSKKLDRPIMLHFNNVHMYIDKNSKRSERLEFYYSFVGVE